MWRKWLVCVWKFLNRPMFGTKIIPPHAWVNPGSFSEEEFPLYCVQCDYLLRGLSGTRCPECGHHFDRGRLLVEQYVTEPLRRDWDNQRIGRWAVRFAAAGLGVLGLWCAGNYAFYRFGLKLPLFQHNPNNPKAAQLWIDRLEILSAMVWYVQVLILVMLLICTLFAWKVYRRNILKRHRVIEAIFEHEE